MMALGGAEHRSIEAMTLGLLGALAGAAVGFTVCMAINAGHVSLLEAMAAFTMSDTLNLAVRPAAVLGAMLFITACTTVISLVPSYLAARLKPVTAMHHVG